jgi:hypothetical protein
MICHKEANNIPVDGPTVKGGTSEFALMVDTEFKCVTVLASTVHKVMEYTMEIQEQRSYC